MKNKKQSFMGNVMIILFAQIAVKLLGVIYRMVITNIDGFGNSGNGYYNAGYQVYTLLLAISSVGIPNAISKMTSARNAVGDYRGAHKIFKTALLLFAMVGVLGASALFFGAEFISDAVLHMSRSKYVLMSLAPSIFFVCISSVIRGYFVGMNDMRATSRSQVLEQIFKCILTVSIVVAMAGMGLFPEDADMNSAVMAAGANLATTLATVLSTAYLFIFYMKEKKNIAQKIALSSGSTLSKPIFAMFKSILIISIPISLGSIISAVNRIVDTATITRGIEVAFAAMIPAHDGTAAIFSPTAAQLNKEAVRLSGILSKSDTLLNLPIAMNISFATVLVPSISAALAKNNKPEAAKYVSYSLLISILLILPCAVGYIILAEPIYGVIYPNAPQGFELLQLSSVALIFIALNQTISGSLQGLGKVFAPATGLLMGCIAKFILNVVLIRRPEINIYGAPISSIACQVISFSYGFTVLTRNISFRLGLKKYVLKPLGAAACMGAVTYLSYRGLFALTSSLLVSLMLSILLSAAVYFLAVLKLRVLTREEIQMLPGGEGLYRLLVKIKLCK